MKITHKLVIGAALVVVVSIMAFAAEKPAPKERVIRIQSDGQTIAEVHLLSAGHIGFGGVSTVSTNGDATVSPNGNGMVMGVVTFDNGQVLRFDTSAKFSGKAEDLGLKSE